VVGSQPVACTYRVRAAGACLAVGGGWDLGMWWSWHGWSRDCCQHGEQQETMGVRREAGEPWGPAELAAVPDCRDGKVGSPSLCARCPVVYRRYAVAW